MFVNEFLSVMVTYHLGVYLAANNIVKTIVKYINMCSFLPINQKYLLFQCTGWMHIESLDLTGTENCTQMTNH